MYAAKMKQVHSKSSGVKFRSTLSNGSQAQNCTSRPRGGGIWLEMGAKGAKSHCILLQSQAQCPPRSVIVVYGRSHPSILPFKVNDIGIQKEERGAANEGNYQVSSCAQNCNLQDESGRLINPPLIALFPSSGRGR